MWAKLVQLVLTYIVLPLFSDGIKWVISYWKKKQAEGKTNKEIDDGVDELEKSTTKEEQKDALKKIVQGVRRRRRS